MISEGLPKISFGMNTINTNKDDKISKRMKKKKVSVTSSLKDVAFEESGYLEKDHETEIITQHDILNNVDILSAQKYFELNLENFGPYRLNYTRNGRNLLIGGNKGHIAAFDWQTKRLMCEINCMETVHDVKWLHLETMFAVAQNKWTYIYDNEGVELHTLKILDRVIRLEFLPYHFLLTSLNNFGYLSYIDVSLGKKVAGFSTQHGRCDIMAQNPINGIINLGHSNGVVTMWSPNVKEPLVKMLCHKSAIQSLALNQTGQYMITSGLDHLLNVWDLRTYKQLNTFKLKNGATSLAFSQKNLIAVSSKNSVEIYKNNLVNSQIEHLSNDISYLYYHLTGNVQNTQFCPYEDVLGIAHTRGCSSILVPGSGEPNFDALEANPYQTKEQRKNFEVKALLDKIQPELINLDSSKLRQIDEKSLEQKMIERNKLLFLKPKKIEFKTKNKMKGKNKASRKEGRKLAAKSEAMREYIHEINELKEKETTPEIEKKSIVFKKFKNKYNIFDRFNKK